MKAALPMYARLVPEKSAAVRPLSENAPDGCRSSLSSMIWRLDGKEMEMRAAHCVNELPAMLVVPSGMSTWPLASGVIEQAA